MIHLMYAGNHRVFDGILISALSYVKHSTQPATLWVLTMDYSDANPAYLPLTEADCQFVERILKEKHPESCVKRCDVGELYRTHLAGNPNEETSYTPYTLLRLLSDRLPLLPDKVLYLDTDTVFAADPAPLYHTDMAGYELGVVRDRYGRFFFGPNYFNAGMLLMNMRYLRETGTLRRAADMVARKKIFLPDQGALNKAVKHKLMLPRRYNEQKEVLPDTVIRHFSMTITSFVPLRTQNVKPWNVEGMHELLNCHEFDDILARWEACCEAKKSEPVSTL